MEEKIGEIWHRLITRAAETRHPEAAVQLTTVRNTLGVIFRALGGDGGLQVEAASATEHGARRGLLQRIAGTHKKVELAWRDDNALHLPPVIDLFPESRLNRELYIWLAALATSRPNPGSTWLVRNQQMTLDTLSRFPGLTSRYTLLVERHLAQRPDPDRLPEDEQIQESAIRQALTNPGSVAQLPPARRSPHPVPLWMHPFPPLAGVAPAGDAPESQSVGKGPTRELEDQGLRRAERAEKPKAQDQGLITIRMENLFSWGEYLKLDRGSEENEDLDSAADAARDMDQIALSRDAQSSAGKLKFDMDLPAAAEDDLVLSEGILLPEWDYRKQLMQPEHCRLVPMMAADADGCDLPAHLNRTARKLKAQFQHLAPARSWFRAQQEGCEIDIDAFLRFTADRAAGRMAAADGLYRDLRIGARDLACLLLADLSLSTDSWINNQQRVIDVIRDSLYLFAESLDATGDRFAMYGFSSRRRDPVRFHQIKSFDESYTRGVRGRIGAIRPGFYTRMGAAIRRSTQILSGQPAGRRLLLILTDGKPNDLDKYEGRYGIEDTRQAIREAQEQGLQPFCVTIDTKGSEYLPHLFGSGGYVVIHKPSQLPRELPLLYARLTA